MYTPVKETWAGGEKEEHCFHVFKEIRRGAKSHLLKPPLLPLMKTNFSMGGIHFLLPLPPLSLPKQAAKGCTLMLPAAAAYIIFFLLGTPPHLYDPVSQWHAAHGSDLWGRRIEGKILTQVGLMVSLPPPPSFPNDCARRPCPGKRAGSRAKRSG